MSKRSPLDALDAALAAAGTCGYSLVTGQPCPTHGKPAEAVATLTVRPAEDDPDRLTVQAETHGIRPAAVAYALREAADALDERARAIGDEPIPYRLTDQAEAVEEQAADPAPSYADDVRAALDFNAPNASPALYTLRDILLDSEPHTPREALTAARILLAAHARELAGHAEDHITTHRAATPKGRDARALRTGMASIRNVIEQQGRRLDDQAQR